jgi:PAS domain-containing protein
VKLSAPQLRARAEAKLASVSRGKFHGPPAEELLHDLQVHQIELEMQNEELQRAQLALEESRDRYLDLYEFAPMGYFTLTDKALIAEVNLSGAAQLGEERGKLLGFTDLVCGLTAAALALLGGVVYSSLGVVVLVVGASCLAAVPAAWILTRGFPRVAPAG